jgi:Helix-turn-helix domain
MSEQEEREVQRLVKATSERLDVVSRAKVLVAVASGKPFTEAASEAGLERGKGASQLVKRFNTHGLAALSITAGLRHKPTYTSEQLARKLAEVQRRAN